MEDEAGPLAEFQEIAGNAVTCTYLLEKQLDVSKVSVKLDDVPSRSTAPPRAGNPPCDNRQVEITGESLQGSRSPSMTIRSASSRPATW